MPRAADAPRCNTALLLSGGAAADLTRAWEQMHSARGLKVDPRKLDLSWLTVAIQNPPLPRTAVDVVRDAPPGLRYRSQEYIKAARELLPEILALSTLRGSMHTCAPRVPRTP